MDIQGHRLPTGHKRQGEEENLREIEKLLVDLLLARYCIGGKTGSKGVYHLHFRLVCGSLVTTTGSGRRAWLSHCFQFDSFL